MKSQSPTTPDDIKQIDQGLIAVTDMLSNRVRTIAGGTVAFGWYAIVGLHAQNPAIVPAHSLFAPVILSLLSLFADFLQVRV